MINLAHSLLSGLIMAAFVTGMFAVLYGMAG